ncbi:MAG: glycosyltransferase family 2 protein [Proteobacteria bacterium]|nr:glycosyltransferase family 2 protein [Pseudomonadota bacterium]
MRAAIVIVNYNSGLLLERCLQSLRDQTLQPDHVVVVDNASTETLSHQLLDELPGIEVIRMKSNAGYGAAINRATRDMADVDLLCCLNPDAFPAPDWLERLVNAADTHPDYHSFASLMLKAEDPSVVDGAGDVLHCSGIPWRRYHGKPLNQCRIRREPVFSPCAGAAMYRLKAFREVGEFDERLFMYVEDVDLGFRLQLAGKPCLLVPEARVLHIGSAITGERSDFSSYYGHRNLVYQYLKNMPLILLILTLPLHLAANIATVLILSFRGSGKAILRAKKDAIALLPEAVAARKQTTRTISIREVWRILGLPARS